MKKNALLPLTVMALIALTFSACGGGAASEDTAADEAVRPTPITSEPSQPPDGSTAVRVSDRPTPGGRRYQPEGGERSLTILTPKSQVVVLNRVPGMVNSLRVEEGDRVSAGAVLATLERDSYRLRAARAAAEAERTRAIYRRNREAFGEEARVRIVSELELEVSRAEYLQAQVDSTLAAKELGYTDVTAPISGHVIERRIQPGQWLGTQEECFTIADLDVLWAVFTVPHDSGSLPDTGSAVSLRVDPQGRSFTTEGTIRLVSPVVDPGGGVKITVEVRVSSFSTLRSGMTVELIQR